MLYMPLVGKTYDVEVTIDTKGLGNCLGIELVAVPTENNNNEPQTYNVQELEVVKEDGNLITYALKNTIAKAGAFRFSFRMYPKNPDLPHRQDFAYVRWF